MGDCGHAPSMCPVDCHALDAYLPRTPVAETIEDVRCKLRDAVAAFNECDEERERTAIEREEWKARALAAEAGIAVARQHGLLAAAWRIASVADGIAGTTVDPAAQRAMREAERLLAALAMEADDAG